MTTIKYPTELKRSAKRLSLLLVAILMISIWSINFEAAFFGQDWRQNLSTEKEAGSKVDDRLKSAFLGKVKSYVPS